MKADRIKEFLLQAGRTVLKVATRNVGLKILSVVLAIMLWSYIISSNENITRLKVHTGLQGYVSSQMTLDVNNLAMVSDPTAALSNITVEVEVPLASYAASTAENVQVFLDLSSVRTAGVQEVPIKATTAHGTIKRIYPATVTMEFESLDSRSIPVNIRMEGTEDGYWYNCARVNPSQITISGATSIVQDISSVTVITDVSGHTSSFSTACRIELKDKEGNIIPAALLNKSSSSVSIFIEVYPTKELEVSSDYNDVIIGQVADGYEVESITIQPSTITVAAEAELLDDLDMLIIDPIEIDSPTQTFTRRATISGLSDFKYISSEQVYVNVHIVEESISRLYDGVDINYVGLGSGLVIVDRLDTASMYVYGPRSDIESIDKDTLSLTVDLTGLGEGVHELTLMPDISDHTETEFQPDPEKITVELRYEDAE